MNVKNKTIFTGDNLPIMRGMNSESVDLIYLDPPFNSKANYAAPIGSAAAGAAFKDTWTLQDVDVAWLDLIKAKHPKLHRVIFAAMTGNDKSYLIYMAVRLLEMRRILKPTGSIYLHCDPTMSHYLKLVLDAIFGRQQFRNEIIWSYGGRGMAKRWFQRKHDVILAYGKKSAQTFFNVEGASREVKREDQGRYNEVDADGNRYARVKNKDGGYSNIYLTPVVAEDCWRIPYVRGKEATGYPTQKPLALLERIIKATTSEGDLVFDPFCGCATALVSSETWQRQWIGIDISPQAAALVRRRIEDAQGLFEDITSRTDVPQRTDMGRVPKYNCDANQQELYTEQSGRCTVCDMPFDQKDLAVDHIIAVSSGGTDHISNLQLLCSPCSRIKDDRGMEYLEARLAA